MGRQVFTHADLDGERELLASVLMDGPTVLDEIGDVLQPEDLHGRMHAAAFEAMRNLAQRGEELHPINLRAELLATDQLRRNGGDEALHEITEVPPVTRDLEGLARRLARLAAVRTMHRTCMEQAAKSAEPLADPAAFLDETVAAVTSAADYRRDEGALEGLGRVLHRVHGAIGERLNRPGGIQGLPTGLSQVDRILAGLKPGQLIIVAGRPGMGKSAFAQKIALSAARHAPTAIFSLEMTKEEWGERMACSEARINADRARLGTLDGGEMARLTDEMARLARLPIRLDDTPAISLWSLRAKLRRMKARDGLGLALVDYLQLMKSGERYEKREQEVAAVSRGLKALAKELRIPIVALAQLNRKLEGRPSRRPEVGDLRESGQIEQDADAILLLHRPCMNSPRAPRSLAEVIVGKQRGGPTGLRKVAFFEDFTRFDDLVDDPDDPSTFAD